jgi:glycogen(starch) synthase
MLDTWEAGDVRVMVLSWEYPPVVYGGLGRHVHALCEALARAGHDVTVLTQHHPGTPFDEVLGGVRVVRVPADPPLVPMKDLLAWVMAFNHTLARAALRLVGPGEVDVLHAHDWLVAHAAAAVKEGLGVPLVATMHATEAGRHQGWLPSDLSKAIHSIEWWLTYEARRVLTCSASMRQEVTRLFELPRDKVDVVPNGVDPRGLAARPARMAQPHVPTILYAGRLEYEKGVQTLLRALPRLKRRHPGLRLVVAGTGTYESALRGLARTLRLGRTVDFAGHLNGPALAGLLGRADVVVVPSIYEPFGMVALEAAVAGVPLVVSDVGGLREIVSDGVTGLRVTPEDVGELAEAVHRLLTDKVLARGLAAAAREHAVSAHGWDALAALTATTYERAVTEEAALQAHLRPPLRLVVRDGNLLADA